MESLKVGYRKTPLRIKGEAYRWRRRTNDSFESFMGVVDIVMSYYCGDACGFDRRSVLPCYTFNRRSKLGKVNVFARADFVLVKVMISRPSRAFVSRYKKVCTFERSLRCLTFKVSGEPDVEMFRAFFGRHELFGFNGGELPGRDYVTVLTSKGQKKVVEKEHYTFSRRFIRWLELSGRSFSYEYESTEVNRADMVISLGTGPVVIEFKIVTRLTLRRIIRQAIGQLLETACSLQTEPVGLWIVINRPASAYERSFIDSLRERTALPFVLISWSEGLDFSTYPDLGYKLPIARREFFAPDM